MKKAKQRREKQEKKAEVRKEERRRLAAGKRVNNPTMRPCPSCGKTDHSRKSSSLCDNFVVRNSDHASLTRKSTIKSSMQSCCDNVIFIQVLQDTVKKCRNFCCTASYFMNFLLLRRLRDNQPILHKSRFCLRCFLSNHRSRRHC
jgi:hypothetical protein